MPLLQARMRQPINAVHPGLGEVGKRATADDQRRWPTLERTTVTRSA